MGPFDGVHFSSGCYIAASFEAGGKQGESEDNRLTTSGLA
jgi:hypothetical protein